MTKVVPKITSIDEMETILPRYVWLDEDEKQVSPVHMELRSAFSFVMAWPERWGLLITKNGEPKPEDFTQSHSPYRAMTRTGKPPVKLKRVEVKILVVDATDEENAKADILLERSKDE